MSKNVFVRPLSLILLLCTLFLLVSSEGAGAAGHTQNDAVSNFIKDVKDKVSIMTEGSCGDNCTSLEKYVGEILDLVGISKFVMGRHWTAANGEQRARFAAAYGEYIRNAYASHLKSYAAHQMRILKTRQIADGSFLVKTRLDDPDSADDFLVLEFHVIDNGEGVFRIVDVKINNTISIASSERSAVDNAIQTHGLDNTILQFERRLTSSIHG